MKYDAFISYSRIDKGVADAACAILESRSIRCWIAPRDVTPGQDWGAEIVSAIADCRVMVVILSQSANRSTQVKREVERAVSKGVVILPFRIEDVQLSPALEYFISGTHWLDALTVPMEQHLRRLADTVSRIIAPGPQPRPIEAKPEVQTAHARQRNLQNGVLSTPASDVDPYESYANPDSMSTMRAHADRGFVANVLRALSRHGPAAGIAALSLVASTIAFGYWAARSDAEVAPIPTRFVEREVPSSDALHFLAMSPDGKTLATFSGRLGRTMILQSVNDGRADTLVLDADVEYSYNCTGDIKWSPNSDYLVFESSIRNRPGQVLQRIRLKTRQVEQLPIVLTNDACGNRYGFLANADSIFVTRENSVAVYSARTGVKLRSFEVSVPVRTHDDLSVFARRGSRPIAATASPSGRWMATDFRRLVSARSGDLVGDSIPGDPVAWADADSRLLVDVSHGTAPHTLERVRFDANSGRIVQRETIPVLNRRNDVWALSTSQKGDAVAMIRQPIRYAIWLFRKSSRSDELDSQLATRDSLPSAPSISLDGKQLAFGLPTSAGDSSDVVVADASTGSQQSVARVKGSLFQLLWFPHEAELLVAVSDVDSLLFRVSIEKRTIAELATPRRANWAPIALDWNGERVAYVRRGDNVNATRLIILSLTGKPQQLTSVPDEDQVRLGAFSQFYELNQLAFSQSGQEIFGLQTRGRLYSLDLASMKWSRRSERKLLTPRSMVGATTEGLLFSRAENFALRMWADDRIQKSVRLPHFNCQGAPISHSSDAEQSCDRWGCAHWTVSRNGDVLSCLLLEARRQSVWIQRATGWEAHGRPR